MIKKIISLCKVKIIICNFAINKREKFKIALILSIILFLQLFKNERKGICYNTPFMFRVSSFCLCYGRKV